MVTDTPSLATSRLLLLAATAQMIRWEMHHHPDLADALGAIIPAAWPPENVRDALDLFAKEAEAHPNALQWGVYYWLSNAEVGKARVLVGSGGFRGAPDEDGAVEIGYGTLDQFQGRGYATEAVQALAEWAYTQTGVKTVFAEAASSNPASLRVLEKSGFIDDGDGSEPGLRRYLHAPTGQGA